MYLRGSNKESNFGQIYGSASVTLTESIVVKKRLPRAECIKVFQLWCLWFRHISPTLKHHVHPLIGSISVTSPLNWSTLLPQQMPMPYDINSCPHCSNRSLTSKRFLSIQVLCPHPCRERLEILMLENTLSLRRRLDMLI